MGKIGRLAFILCLVLFTAGCSIKASSTEKLNDLEFTVVDEEDIPEEMAAAIAENKEKPLKTTYSDKGYLYICEGYGEQSTSGYSIQVATVYETKNAIYIHTNLLGPDADEEVVEQPTYPYVVIKLEDNEKNVVFD